MLCLVIGVVACAVTEIEWCLADVVAFSSRLIAAARVVESERDDALFVDPLAPILAGMCTTSNHHHYHHFGQRPHHWRCSHASHINRTTVCTRLAKPKCTPSEGFGLISVRVTKWGSNSRILRYISLLLGVVTRKKKPKTFIISHAQEAFSELLIAQQLVTYCINSI
jgi:hypothetical protein